MILLLCCALLVLVNYIIYFCIGSLAICRLKDKPFSAGQAVIVGFFLYYCLFELICLPMVATWQRLSRLSLIWAILIAILCLISIALNIKIWKTYLGHFIHWVRANAGFVLIVALMLLTEILVIVHSYQFTLDAAYYVATATTALETDMMNVYDPYTGLWQDHFEMRYFFQTYPLQDAVMCRLTGLHPLLWTKRVMEAVSIILSNLVLYQIAKHFFKERYEAIGLFLFFCNLMNFFFTTIYTSAAFFTTRTYEGKTLVGNVVIPLIFWIYLKMQETDRYLRLWLFLLLVAAGAAALSNSANMLVPAAVGIFTVPLFIRKKDWRIIPGAFAAMLPGIVLMAVYVAYVRGLFVLYTYPR